MPRLHGRHYQASRVGAVVRVEKHAPREAPTEPESRDFGTPSPYRGPRTEEEWIAAFRSAIEADEDDTAELFAATRADLRREIPRW